MTLAIADNVNTILVDFFDTLVERICHPEVVKRKWCAALIDNFIIGLSVDSLYQLRLKIEAEQCSFSQNNGFDAEFCYRDMVASLYIVLKKMKTSTRLNDFESFHETCIFIEECIEIDVQRPINKNIDLIRKEKEKGKKIYLLSDFYLSKKTMEKFSEYHGFLDVFDDLYISSEIKKTKKDGQAYNYIIEKLNLNVKHTIMLGDNIHSDVDMPQSKNMLAYHLAKDMTPYNKSLELDSNRVYINKLLNNLINANDFNFNWIGGAIYLFTRRLYWSLVNNGAQNVYFFAREGEFLKKVFDEYQNCLPIKFKKIKTHYMYVSRRATYLPSLNELKISSFNKLLYQYGSCSLVNFLKSINLDEYISILENEWPSVDFYEQHLNIAALPAFKEMIYSNKFKAIYDKERKEQKEYLLNYCDKIMSETRNQFIHVVDVGWKGSIQDNIGKATGRKIHGYYLGVLEGAESSAYNIKDGVLFDYQQGICFGNDIFNEFRASFEVFMGASHGSLKKYLLNDFVFDDNDEEKELFDEKIRAFQKKVKNQFYDFITIERKYSISNHEISHLVIKNYFRRVILPNKMELIEFSLIKHYENFGVFDFSAFNVKKRSSKKYILRLLQNPKATVGSAWWKPLDFYLNKVGFLKYPYFLFKKFKHLKRNSYE